MTQKQRIKRIFIIFIIIMQLFLLSSCAFRSNASGLTGLEPGRMGNTMDNLLSVCTIANDDDYIYYMVLSKSEGVLYRKSITDGEAQAIGEGIFLALNVVDGFIYYINGFDYNLYRMAINGEQIEEINDNIEISFMIVYNDTIYVTGYAADSDTVGHLYAMNTDGSDVRILSDDRIWGMYLYEDNIYYAAFTGEQTSFYKMDLSGENKELIFEYYAANFQFFVYNGDIYQASFETIRRVDANTQEHSIVYTADDRRNIFLLNRKDNILFFRSTSFSTMPRTYYWLDLDTGEISSTNDIDGEFFHVINDRIFYYANNNTQICTMNLDGTDVKRFH